MAGCVAEIAAHLFHANVNVNVNVNVVYHDFFGYATPSGQKKKFTKKF